MPLNKTRKISLMGRDYIIEKRMNQGNLSTIFYELKEGKKRLILEIDDIFPNNQYKHLLKVYHEGLKNGHT